MEVLASHMSDKFYIADSEILTPAGQGVLANVNHFFCGATFLRQSNGFYTGQLAREDSEVVENLKSSRHLKVQDRATLIAILMGQNLADRHDIPDSYGVLVGSSRGLTHSLEDSYKSFLDGQRLSPVTSPTTTSSALPTSLARELGLRGPVSYLSAACSTSMIAIIHSCALMKMGLAEGFIAGGVEASLTPYTFSMLEAAKVMTKYSEASMYPCQPMKGESGMVLSEGGGLVLVEKSPKREPLAEIIGWSIKAEKSTLTGISQDGRVLQDAIRQSLDISGLDSSEIDLIVGHGSGTFKGDHAEAAAYDQMFDQNVPKVFHKWLFGHMLGGSAVVSLILGIQHLIDRKIPGHPYFADGHQLKKARELKRSKYLLVTSLGFGGIASCMIVKNMRA